MLNQERLHSMFPKMVERRRHLHQNPELSYQEERTSAYIKEQLEPLNIDILTHVGGHGLVASIKGVRPGRTVAIRADMDALPIQDEKITSYASQVPGVMHACGHDGHTAVLLAVAEYFSLHRNDLAGEVRCIFQPAEEVCPGGASAMIKDGVLAGVDVIYGVHLWTPIPIGTAASTAGPMMASTDEFFIDIEGQGGHGGMPHQAVDSVVAGASLVMQLQSIVSRSVDPLHPAVVTIGSIHGGTVQNVIAEHCHLSGTVRCFSDETRELIRTKIERIANHTAETYGAKANIQYVMGYPPLVNHVSEVERFFRSAAEVPNLKAVETLPIMPAEDFAYYVQQVPGCFVLVGAGNPEKGAIYPHHHPKFDMDEEAMLLAAKLLVQMTETYFNDTHE
ncbi:amidohydrolase [Paenibacillus shirakamiensis]|uniref:Amidohydrolase n=1 Tax=Paenibacillus shirakamiensis TaxID=1265935 RepID=A0ABS4JE44_9BACL|nr:amidohydrolase [Paenibacillus shirakamiensis]MBP1999330.1 amidohydrolase [Paenibacillus shirakamiensis]